MNIHHLTYLSITLRFQVIKKFLETIFKYAYHKAQLLLQNSFINFYLPLSNPLVLNDYV